MLNNKPKTPRELRKFGLTMAAVFLLLGGLTFWKGHAVWMGLAPAGLLFLLGVLARPSLLRPIEKGWMKVALYLSMVVTTLLLSLVYYLVVTPIGLFLRKVLRKDLLKLKWDRRASSYWDPADPDGPGSRPFKPY